MNTHLLVANVLDKVVINDGEEWSHEIEEIEPGLVRFRLLCRLPDTTVDHYSAWKDARPQPGRWWYVEHGDLDEQHSPESHILRTAWLAYETFMLHEMRERFLFDGKLPFNPHQEHAA